MAVGGDVGAELDAAFDIVQSNLGDDWIDLGFKLGLKYNIVEEMVDRSQTFNLIWRNRTMLEKWRQQEGKQATVQGLLHALKKIKRQDLVDRLRAMYPDLQDTQLNTDITENSQAVEMVTPSLSDISAGVQSSPPKQDSAEESDCLNVDVKELSLQGTSIEVSSSGLAQNTTDKSQSVETPPSSGTSTGSLRSLSPQPKQSTLDNTTFFVQVPSAAGSSQASESSKGKKIKTKTVKKTKKGKRHKRKDHSSDLKFVKCSVKSMQHAKQKGKKCFYIVIETSDGSELDDDSLNLCKEIIEKHYNKDNELGDYWSSSICVQMFPKTDESIRELNRDQESGRLAADLKTGFENIGLNCLLEVKILTMEELEEEVAEIVEEAMDVFVLSEMQETGEDSEASAQTYEELRDDWRDENEKSAKPTKTVRKVKSPARLGVRRLEFALNAVQSQQLAKEMRTKCCYLKIQGCLKDELVSGAQNLERKAMEDLSEFYKANKDLSRAAIIKVFKRHKVLRKGLKIAKMWPTSETDECVKALDSGQVTYRLTEYEKIGYHGPSQGDVRSMEQLEEDVLSETCEQTTQTDKVLGEGHKTDTDVPEDNETSTQTYEELRDAWRDALLRITAWTGDEDKVKTLLQAGVQVNTENSEGETPFCDAVTGGHSNIVKLLLQKGADPGAGENTARSRERASGMGKTLLHLAAEIGSVEWLSHLPITVVNKDETDRMGRTPLSVAAERGHAEVVSFLLYAWADVYKEDGDGRTPMWWAAWSGHAEVLRILRRQGFADMHMADCMGRTPLWVAAEKGHVDVVEFLVEEDGRPGIADLEQKTPLWIAAHNGNMEVVKVLIEAMAAEGSGLERDISKPDKTGKTPYQAAVERKHSDVAKVIEDQVTKTLQKKS